MRVLLDTNVLISALLFPTDRVNKLFENVLTENTLVLSDYIIEELYAVVERKFPKQMNAVKKMLSIWNYELIYTPHIHFCDNIIIRDIKDYPVLEAAVYAKVDVLITGDKDFENLEVECIEILTPQRFIEKYVL